MRSKSDKRRDHKKRLKSLVRDIKRKSECRICGSKSNLTFHHVSGRGPKKRNISDAVSKGVTFRQIRAELAKCDVLCEPCHGEMHWYIEMETRRIYERIVKGEITLNGGRNGK